MEKKSHVPNHHHWFIDGEKIIGIDDWDSQHSMGWSDLRCHQTRGRKKTRSKCSFSLLGKKQYGHGGFWNLLCLTSRRQTTIMIPNTVELPIQNLIFWDVTYDTQHFGSQNLGVELPISIHFWSDTVPIDLAMDLAEIGVYLQNGYFHEENYWLTFGSKGTYPWMIFPTKPGTVIGFHPSCIATCH